MTAQRTQIALTGLQWTLGLVILIEAILFVMPGAAHGFAKTHMPNLVRLILGFGEIAGCVLMLIPRTATRGAFCMGCTTWEIWRSTLPQPGRSR